MRRILRYIISIGLGVLMMVGSLLLMWFATMWRIEVIVFLSLFVYALGIFIGWALTGLVKPKMKKVVKMRRRHQIYTFK